MKKKLTVILVTKNAILYISEALDNILSNKKFIDEIIVIDSGSTDGTVDIINTHLAEITYFLSELDDGIYDGMNKGIEHSNSEWLYFIGADDRFYDSEVLSDFIALLGRAKNINKFDLIYGKYSFKNNIYRSHFDWRLIFSNVLNHQSVFFNRKCFIQFKYDKSFRVAGDYDFNLRHFLSGSIGFFFDRVIVKYGSDGISSVNKNLSELEMEKVRLRYFGPYISLLIKKLKFFRKHILSFSLGDK